MNILEKMIRDLETMAAANPNRPLGEYWFRMREDGSYRKAMCALTVFDDRASFEDEARAGLTGATRRLPDDAFDEQATRGFSGGEDLARGT